MHLKRTTKLDKRHFPKEETPPPERIEFAADNLGNIRDVWTVQYGWVPLTVCNAYRLINIQKTLGERGRTESPGYKAIAVEIERRRIAGRDPEGEVMGQKPTIVCLCGSTRFYDTWQEANFNETLAGKIVLSVGFYPHCAEKAHAAHVGITPEQKIALDELHKRKIDLADEVLILNVGGYIGESTKSELEYAISHGKHIRMLEGDVTYNCEIEENNA